MHPIHTVLTSSSRSSLLATFYVLLTMAPHAGVIIAASVLVAASIAAYENPQIREWIQQSSQKVAIAFRSLGDDIHGRKRPRPSREDSSMHEDVDDKAEERRRQARQEIMEKGRVLQEKRRRPSRSSSHASRTPSFDLLVDEDGRLKAQDAESNRSLATSTALQQSNNQGLRSRHEYPQMHESVDAPILLRQLDVEQIPSSAVPAIEPWESQYEQEMRNAWNIDLPSRSADPAHSHASESLIDLTPTTEDFPDPDYSVPDLRDSQQLPHRSEYFSAAASQSSHPLSRAEDSASGVMLSQPITPPDPRLIPHQDADTPSTVPSAHASLAGSVSHVNHSDAELSDDDMSDTFGDGIRTPGSAWTEVGSSVSGDD